MSKARQILKSENEMLEGLVAQIDGFAKKYTGFEADNLKCWGKELSGYRDINNKYLALDDVAFEKALREEIQTLDNCLNSITSKSDSAQYWRTNLDENKWYTSELISRISQTS